MLSYTTALTARAEPRALCNVRLAATARYNELALPAPSAVCVPVAPVPVSGVMLLWNSDNAYATRASAARGRAVGLAATRRDDVSPVGMPLRESNTDGDALRAAGTAAK